MKQKLKFRFLNYQSFRFTPPKTKQTKKVFLLERKEKYFGK